ncbi:MAG TPA: hypothetical protein DCL38_06795 [Lachnospiraceae bacterium]|nr:hypothetical protein [Lachnospiraceae bacterium]
MFGYVTVNKQELKFREFDRYRAYYCGLCQELKERYGKTAQFTLSYDMTFVIMLLSVLYEEEAGEGMVRCLAHPFEKHPTRKNRFTSYAADMNLLLSYEKCEDDWRDERRPVRKLYAMSLRNRVKRVKEQYPLKVKAITDSLELISRLEKEKESNIDLPAGAFGEIMAQVLAYKQDEWEDTLKRLGFFLGKFVYIADAYEDLEKDRRSGSYNPLLLRKNGEGDVDSDVEEMLVMMMGECSRAFERLPIVDGDVEILRNILYSGVWCRYQMTKEKRKK